MFKPSSHWVVNRVLAQPIMCISHDLLFATRSLQPSLVRTGRVPFLVVFLKKGSRSRNITEVVELIDNIVIKTTIDG